MNIINIAFTGAQAARQGMSTTSMNVANYLTPGYSRQGIIQSAIGTNGDSFSAGNGVRVDSIRRISDQYLVNQVWHSNTRAEYYSAGQKYLGALESVIGTDSTSLGGGLDKFFAALNALTTQPDSPALRQQLLNEGQSMATRFNNVDSFISSQKVSINTQREALVSNVNVISSNIASYNQQIADQEATGGNASVLRDQRDELVKQLSSMVSVKVSEDASGRYNVSLSDGQPLVNGRHFGQLKSSMNQQGEQDISLEFHNTTFGVSSAIGGQMGALNDYEQGTLKTMQSTVRDMAEQFAKEFNDQLAKGFDLNGQPGKPLFVFDLTSGKGMLQVTDLKPDELALSDKADESGNGTNLKALIELKNKDLAIGNMGNMSVNEAAAAIISSVGIASRQNKTELDAAEAVRYEAQTQRDNLSAVNQDEEAMNLQVYMQAYQSNLKVIATGNQIFSDLLTLF
ncbi:flagellar hook-associated protein FlgK [Buttiauxella gaviniae]|uniref:Flagellar hook-associated protein 1 n=1 Tax=Buttiauxella gaviniae TaxID=82990 RepID=A0ABV3NPV9_9ENTR